MVVTLVSDLSIYSPGFYADYNNIEHKVPGWVKLDVRAYVHKKQDVWQEQVENWHAELSVMAQKNINLWWLLPSSRLISWSPPVLKPFFFVIAALELAEKNSLNAIYLSSCPYEVIEHIKEVGKKKNYIVVNDSDRRNNNQSIIYSSLRFLYQTLSWTFKSVFKFKNEHKSLKRCKVIAISQIPNVESMINDGEHFFGNTFSCVPGLKSEETVWLFCNDSISADDYQKIKHHFHRIGNQFSFFRDFIKPLDYIVIVFSMLQVVIQLSKSLKKINPLVVGGSSSSIIINKYLYDPLNFRSLHYELLAKLVLPRILHSTNASTVFFPYEEKGIERSIIVACKNYNNYVQTIGLAHAVHNKGLMYLKRRDLSNSNSPKPDLIAVTGDLSKKWLEKNANIPANKMFVSGSKRYKKALNKKLKRNDECAPLNILILIGQGFELTALANYIESDECLFDGYNVKVRRYPFAWKNEQDQALTRINKIRSSIKEDDAPLKEQIKWCDVAIFYSTSAGIEAMLLGRYVIVMNLSDIFCTDAMQGKDPDSIITKCNSTVELKNILKEIQNMSVDEYYRIIDSQISLANKIYSPINTIELSEHLIRNNKET